MKPALVGVLLVALMCLQPVLADPDLLSFDLQQPQAASAAPLAPPVTARDENRQVLIADGVLLDPNVDRRVVTGSGAGQQEVTATATQALDMLLDHLDAHGVRLLSASAASSNPAQQWPALGTFEFHERGWYQAGARCPAYVPDWPQPLDDAFDAIFGGQNDTVAHFNTTVSEHWKTEGRPSLVSTLKFWPPDQDRTTTPAAATWRYGGFEDEGGWTIEAGFLAQQVPGYDYYCQEPTAGTGVVFHDSIVAPVADRTDAPPNP